MTRLFAVWVLASIVMFGQQRETYRVPYKMWRQSSASLEKDAAAPLASFGTQITSASKRAQDYLNARATFLSNNGTSVAAMPWSSRNMTRPEKVLGARPDVHRMLTATDGVLAKAITSFAGTRDTAIREVRQAMERERAALNEVVESLTRREALISELTAVMDEADRISIAAARNSGNASSAHDEMLKSIRTEAVAWGRYYQDLAEGAGIPTSKE